MMMIEGQDPAAGTSDETRLLTCCRLKSAALYGAAAKMGGILGPPPTMPMPRAFRRPGSISATPANSSMMSPMSLPVWRSARSVADAGKCTAIDLFGVEGARRKASEFQARSLSHLERFGTEADWLRQLVTEASWKSS
jgi:geranylgeranyl pyrophosphate synthase